MHVPRTFLALYILIDILDIRDHLVLAWRELAGCTTLQLLWTSGHLGGICALLLHSRLGGAWSSANRVEAHLLLLLSLMLLV